MHTLVVLIAGALTSIGRAAGLGFSRRLLAAVTLSLVTARGILSALYLFAYLAMGTAAMVLGVAATKWGLSRRLSSKLAPGAHFHRV